MNASVKSTINNITHLQSLIIADKQQILYEFASRPEILSQPQNVKSVAKSILPFIFSIFQQRYIFSDESSIYPVLSENAHINSETSEKYKPVRYSHLLSMHTIWDWHETNLHLELFFQHPDPIRYMLKYPFLFDVNPTFNYCTPTSHILVYLIEQMMDSSFVQFAQHGLGDPLDICLDRWGTNSQGIAWGGTDLLLSTREMIVLGQWLMTERDYPSLLESGWVEKCWTVKTHVDDVYFQSFVPGMMGYGYGWWICEYLDQPMYAALGYGGQFLIIFPQSDRMFAGTSLMDNNHPGNVKQFQLVMNMIKEIMESV